MAVPKGVMILAKLLYHVLVGTVGFVIVGAAAVGLHFLELSMARNSALSPESLWVARGLADFIFLCDAIGIAVLVVWELIDLIRSITAK